MKLDEHLPIRYTLIEESNLVLRATAFTVLNCGDFGLRRCFMALLHLPANTSQIRSDTPRFAAAVARASELPTFRKVQNRSVPPAHYWEDMKASPLHILMIGDAEPPTWLHSLSGDRMTGVLTSSPETLHTLQSIPGIRAGLLRGFEDLRESYRVLDELISVTTEGGFGVKAKSICEKLIGRDSYRSRPRLDFIPEFRLPPPSHGRPTAYLLNRLSNNVDQPSLAPDFPADGLAMLPSIFDHCMRACAALSLVELNESIPAHMSISESELSDYRRALTDSAAKDTDRFQKLVDLGLRLASKEPLRRPLFAIPVLRTDLARGKGPDTVSLEFRTTREARAAIRAANDYTRGSNQIEQVDVGDKEAYSKAWWTLESEQRLLSCESSWLAARSGMVPIQLQLKPDILYRALKILNSALETNSRKVTRIFQSVEALLADILPEGLISHLAEGTSPVAFFSDLPFEWTHVEGWPVCLTRPVSRIPMSFSHWDVLCAALERPTGIDTSKPGRVLVLTLIEKHDPIRKYSDWFAASSTALKQKYEYASPRSADAFAETIRRAEADIVILDAHGSYLPSKDQLLIQVGGAATPLEDLIPDVQVPPVWILSACHTSVTGAIGGSFVRALLARGAVAVISSLSRVDAFIASMFLGRLLADIFNPPVRRSHKTFLDAFFVTQYTTALLYDPLLPFFRLAEKEPEVRRQLGFVLSDFFAWTRGRELEIRKYRHEIAWFVGESIARHGLQQQQVGHLQSGVQRPETLLFSIFGAPDDVNLN